MKARRAFRTISDICLLFLFVYLLVFPSAASDATKNALDFCLKTLIPSLFIYTVLSKIIISRPIFSRVSGALGIEAVTLLIGLLCGAPIGAKTAAELYKNGSISKRQAEYLCSFSNNASAPFVIGFVGKALLGSVGAGLKLFAFQLFGSLAAACVMRFYMLGRGKPFERAKITARRTDLREALRDSAEAMISISACAVFFTVVSGVLTNLLPMPNIFRVIISAVLEFSSGCVYASQIGNYALPLCAFSIGFLGLSVALQVKTVTEGLLSLKPYLLGKLVSCAVTLLLAVIFG